MISEKTLKSLEFDKILKIVSGYAVLDSSKAAIENLKPTSDKREVTYLLKSTEEAFKLLYKYSLERVPYCVSVINAVSRAEKGATLNMRELLDIAALLSASRTVKASIESVSDESVENIKTLASGLFEYRILEKEITSKIVSEDTMADSASERLASIRKRIRDLNVKIRDKLNSYIRGSNKFMQDNVVTMRMNRYVIPVKAEYKGMVKGFVHDQSATGSTVFIEPEQVIEYNNDLKTAYIEESEEVYRILRELSGKVAGISNAIKYNEEILSDIDVFYAKATYAFETKATRPIVNFSGIISIKKARHPLINPEKVIPVTVTLGKEYKYLLVTGPNTGGKTVTLKLTGLMCLFAMCGLYIPCEEESEVSVFENIFCDIGDEQSIEQSLSTFSSHMVNIIDFCNNLTSASLVLLDELGAGTDPEEGSALALAVIEKLLKSGSCGIVTTHYSRLKEYAMTEPLIENASMDFDIKTLRPVYKLNIGIPGNSNAIEISKRLGLPEDLAKRATELLSKDKVSLDNVLKKAEESRQEAEKLSEELKVLKEEKAKELEGVKKELSSVKAEKEKITASARQEVKKIVSERLIEAEAIVSELNDIYKTCELENGELIRARTLKNKLADSKYLNEDIPLSKYELAPVDVKKLSVGDEVYVKSFNNTGTINGIKEKKGEVEVLFGNIKSTVKLSDCFNAKKQAVQSEKPKVSRSVERSSPKAEINIIGKTVAEGVEEVEKFIDQAVVSNISEIRIIHGMGTGKLKKGVWDYLKTNKNVSEYRLGRYGEGESGVTVVTLK
ncbi:MAG TPA: endonuclease MutS2 [Clostridiales bacterium]|nr:endonuclease MutS2 [Clostridiales bacterium]